MKELGPIYTNLLYENEKYKHLFSPLTKSEYSDLKESIAEVGILNNIIVEKNGDGYVILSGHHRWEIAKDLGIKTISCSLAETPEEKAGAILDNAARRQLTEFERKEYLKKKEDLIDNFYKIGLIPEIYSLIAKLDKRPLQALYATNPDAQKNLLNSLSEQIKIPPAVVEEHKKELMELEEKHIEDIQRLVTKHADAHKKMEQAIRDKEKAEMELADKKKELSRLQNKIEDLGDQLKDETGKLSKNIRKEYEKQLAELQTERENREHLRKEKENEIARLKEEMETYKNNIHGLQTEAKLWEQQAARIEQAYNEFLNDHANPGYIDVQLKVIEAHLQALVKYTTTNKWDSRATKIAEQYRVTIDGYMKDLIMQIELNQKDASISLESASKNVRKALEKEPAEEPILTSVKAVGN